MLVIKILVYISKGLGKTKDIEYFIPIALTEYEYNVCLFFENRGDSRVFLTTSRCFETMLNNFEFFISFSRESVFKEKIEVKACLNYGYSLPRYQKYISDSSLCFPHRLIVSLRMSCKI